MDTPSASTPEPTEAAQVPLSPWKRRLFTAVVLLIVFGMLELAASLYLRVTRGYDGDHLYQYDFDPYKNIHPARNYVDTRGIVHNSQGFRRAERIPTAKPPGTIRVFLMGGSTAYGLGGLWPHLQNEFPVLKNAETIDAYLERDLANAFPGYKVEVINAAVTSTWTHHSFIYLNQTILKFQPDVVMFLDGFNDFYFYEPGHDQFASYGFALPAQTIMGAPTLKSLVYANGWWAFRKSALVHVAGRGLSVLKAIVTPRPTQEPIQVDSALAGLRRTFSANALKMHRRSGLILLDEGITPVFMLQPLLVHQRARRPQMPEIEQKLFDFNVSSLKPNGEEYSLRATEALREIESAMAREIGAEYIDLTGIYAGAKGQMFTDYAHLTPPANEILARVVGERIRPLIAARIAGGCITNPQRGKCGVVAAAPTQAPKN
jgi:hypothetical protein